MNGPRYEANIANVGITSFCRTPICEDFEKIEADVAVLGVPYDASSGWRAGARGGPRDIRTYSPRHSLTGNFDNPGHFDTYTKRCFLAGTTMVDCGDVDIAYTDIDRNFGLITNNVGRILDRGAFPLLLGGDHSISFPIVRAFERMAPLSVVHFDAHMDYHMDMGGYLYSNGSVLRRVSELEFVDKMVHLGIRQCTTAEYAAATKRGNQFVTRDDIRRQGVRAIVDAMPAMENIYVTFDIDALDPSVAPGTGTPLVDGLYYQEARELLRGIATKGKVVGMDLVEVNPYLDTTGRTSLAAVRLMIEFLGDVFVEHQVEPDWSRF